MSGVLQVAIGVCLIILCSGLVNWGNKYYSSRKRRDKKSEQEEDLNRQASRTSRAAADRGAGRDDCPQREDRLHGWGRL